MSRLNPSPAKLVLAMLFVIATASYAQTFQNVVVFGDSLSDVGNGPSSGDYAIPLYTDGVGSNGVNTTPPASALYRGVWIQQLVKMLMPNYTLMPSNTPGGTDYAVAGATTGDGATLNSSCTSPANDVNEMNGQVCRYLLAGALPASSTLYVLFGGGNDVLQGSNPQQSAANETALVGQLFNSGAKYFLVVDLPPIDRTPYEVGNSESGSNSSAFNYALASDLANLQPLESPGPQISYADIYSMVETIVTSPDKYGFNDAIHPAQATRATCNATLSAYSADTTLFWDCVHPSTAGHHQIAMAAYNALLSNSTSLVVNPNPSTAGQPVTFTATVNTVGGSTPTGTVNFYDYANSSNPSYVLIATTVLNSSGVASASVYPNGSTSDGYGIVAAYLGDANYSPEFSNVVSAPTSTTFSSVSRGTSSTTLTATVARTVSGATGYPTGQVSFYSGKFCPLTYAGSAPLISGVATATVAGSSPILKYTAAYSGDVGDSGSSTSSSCVPQS